jgi:hypothetical protein
MIHDESFMIHEEFFMIVRQFLKIHQELFSILYTFLRDFLEFFKKIERFFSDFLKILKTNLGFLKMNRENLLNKCLWLTKSTAKGSLQSTGQGFFDCIHIVKSGFDAIALMGTSISSLQLKLIKDTHRSFILMFDGDEAGRKATPHVEKKLTL